MFIFKWRYCRSVLVGGFVQEEVRESPRGSQVANSTTLCTSGRSIDDACKMIQKITPYVVDPPVLELCYVEEEYRLIYHSYSAQIDRAEEKHQHLQ